MEELKPCPFCGSEAHIQTFHFRYRVGCGTTGCIAGRLNRAFDTPEEAAAAWNRRAERTCRIVSAKEAGRTGYAPACSSCGWQSAVWHQYSYCPNCGARVVGCDDA